MKKTDNVSELAEIARQIRINVLKMIHLAASGHPGGSLSAVEILVSLYFSKMNHSPSHSKTDKRDKFVLSKGHGAPVLYSVLAKCGYFPEEELWTLRKFNSTLSGHPYAPSTPGVEITTGSLGQGLSQANGLALAGRLNKDDSIVYCLMGDGETQEGQIWEAAMTASHYKLGTMVAFIDNNELQIDGFVRDIMGIEPIAKKWEAFGWHVQEIDGHDFGAISSAIEKAKAEKERPSLIKCRTVKGKGVSFMENLAKWHGTAPNADELKKALAELGVA
ncbi:MAG: transketolase [Nitrospinae bacterium]|nr:transketolase [Nitrospinota bacterium]